MPIQSPNYYYTYIFINNTAMLFSLLFHVIRLYVLAKKNNMKLVIILLLIADVIGMIYHRLFVHWKNQDLIRGCAHIM